MKRHVGFQILVILITAMMMLTSFACSKAPEAPAAEATEAAAAEPTEEAAPATEPVTIEFWHGYSESDGQIAVLDELISQFEAANPGITVEPAYMEWSALHDGVVAGATTGTLPDVLRGDIAFVPQFGAVECSGGHGQTARLCGCCGKRFALREQHHEHERQQLRPRCQHQHQDSLLQ